MKKRAFLQRSIGVLFLGVLGAVIGVAAARAGAQPPSPGPGTTGTVALIVLLPLLYFMVVAAHEIGHVVGAILVDFRPLLFIVGPLRIDRARTGRPEYSLNRSFAMAAGHAVCTPVGLHDLRRRMIVMVAGGPVASFMVGSQALALHQATSPAPMPVDASLAARLAAVSLLFLGIVSLLIGIASLLPMRSGGLYSDGARLLRLMRPGATTDREVALLALTGMSHALDRGDVAGARLHLDASLALIDELPAGSRSSVLLTAVTFYALNDDDPEPARALLRRATGRSLVTTPHERVLAEAALHLAEGDFHAAVAAAREAQSRIVQAADRGGAALDHGLAGIIIERATAGAPGSTAGAPGRTGGVAAPPAVISAETAKPRSRGRGGSRTARPAD